MFGHCLNIFRLFGCKFYCPESTILPINLLKPQEKKYKQPSAKSKHRLFFSTYCTLHRRFHIRLLAPRRYRCPCFCSQSKSVPLTVLRLTYDTRHCATIAGNDADIWPRTLQSEACTYWLQRRLDWWGVNNRNACIGHIAYLISVMVIVSPSFWKYFFITS